MSELHFSLDIDRVQSSVNAAIRPAVEAALSTIDIKKIIAEKLSAKDSCDDNLYAVMFGRRRRTSSSMIERLVSDSIEEMAKHYVKSQVEELRGEIEEGFRKMMQGSTNRIVK